MIFISKVLFLNVFIMIFRKICVYEDLQDIDNKSRLDQVMAWCRQATSHYLIQEWSGSVTPYDMTWQHWVNPLRQRQNGRHFPNNIFKFIFLYENVWISFQISLKFVPTILINNIPALVQIMAWRQPGDKPLSEPMMVKLLTHICVTRPQWVNGMFLFVEVHLYAVFFARIFYIQIRLSIYMWTLFQVIISH